MAQMYDALASPGRRATSHRNAGPDAGPMRVTNGYSEGSPRVADPASDDGFSVAFDTYAPLVLRFGQRRLDDRDAARDVVTDTSPRRLAALGTAARPGPDAAVAVRHSG
jgi:hypothetical protein